MSTDRDVHLCIQRYLNRARGRTLGEIVDRAWESVNSYRLQNCGYGEHIVAAEHYLYTRSVCRCVAPPVMATFFLVGIPLYDLYKKMWFASGQRFVMWQESACPPARPSAWVRSWAFMGIHDGAEDTRRRPTERPVAPLHPWWIGPTEQVPSPNMSGHSHIRTSSGDRYF